METINLKIVVTTRFVHPQFGCVETKVTDFYDFAEAVDFYRTNKEKDSVYDFTTIDIVQY